MKKVLLGALLLGLTMTSFGEAFVCTVGKGKKYHHENCRYVNQGKKRGSEIRRITLSEAEREGYKACRYY